MTEIKNIPLCSADANIIEINDVITLKELKEKGQAIIDTYKAHDININPDGGFCTKFSVENGKLVSQYFVITPKNQGAIEITPSDESESQAADAAKEGAEGAGGFPVWAKWTLGLVAFGAAVYKGLKWALTSNVEREQKSKDSKRVDTQTVKMTAEQKAEFDKQVNEGKLPKYESWLAYAQASGVTNEPDRILQFIVDKLAESSFEDAGTLISKLEVKFNELVSTPHASGKKAEVVILEALQNISTATESVTVAQAISGLDVAIEGVASEKVGRTAMESVKKVIGELETMKNAAAVIEKSGISGNFDKKLDDLKNTLLNDPTTQNLVSALENLKKGAVNSQTIGQLIIELNGQLESLVQEEAAHKAAADKAAADKAAADKAAAETPQPLKMDDLTGAMKTTLTPTVESQAENYDRIIDKLKGIIAGDGSKKAAAELLYRRMESALQAVSKGATDPNDPAFRASVVESLSQIMDGDVVSEGKLKANILTKKAKEGFAHVEKAREEAAEKAGAPAAERETRRRKGSPRGGADTIK